MLADLLRQAVDEGEVSDGQKTLRETALRKFSGWLGERVRYADEVSVLLMDEYFGLLRANVKPATFDREVSIIRRAFNYAIERDLLSKNPVMRPGRRISVEQERQERRQKSITPAEWKLIKQACEAERAAGSYVRRRRGSLEKVRRPKERLPRYLLPCFKIILETGLRPGELVQLRWSDINQSDQLINVRHDVGKTGARKIPITEHCDSVLRGLEKKSVYVLTLPNGRPIERRVLTRATTRLFKRLRIAKTLYGFRHAALYRMAEFLPIHKLMKVAGHKKITTTQIYLDCEVSDFKDEFIARMAGA